ncbi:hypothetical protein ACT2CV_09405 [Pasteurellaceae bacterium 22721_9_1]
MKKILVLILSIYCGVVVAKDEPVRIRIDNHSYALIAPVAQPQRLMENQNKLQRLLDEQQRISAVIRATNDKQLLDQQFEALAQLMLEQDKLVQAIFKGGIYSKPFLVKFISFRKHFSHTLKGDFAHFVKTGLADEKNAQRFLTVYDATTSEYESAFLVLTKKFL